MESLVHWSFALAACLAGLLQYRSYSGGTEKPRNGDLWALQRKFFLAYFPSLFADWLQGPYVYKVYASYGFAEFDISLLYLIGFASSVAFGTFTGPLADNFGRRRMCIAYCILYGICCVTKLSPAFEILAFGRICGGIATSLLFSAFESWYVYEHKLTSNLPPEFIPLTFSTTTFWNGLLAIFAGIVANIAAESFALGPVSPFIVAIPFLVLAAVVIATSWSENYGEKGHGSWLGSCSEGFEKILADADIWLLGSIQSLFESVMYIFVFMWTPVLSPGNPPLGYVFAVYMVCVMIGSSVFRLAFSDGLVNSSRALQVASKCLLVSMGVTSLMQSDYAPDLDGIIPGYKHIIAYAMFLLLEISVGIYFPAIGTLRSHVIPESHRASIMNWFRVPMNIITCLFLIFAKKANAHKVFFGCTVLAICCVLAASKLHKRLFGENGKEIAKNPLVEVVSDEEVEEPVKK